LYPKTNKDLALRILNSGGIILSEFEPTFQATPWTFPARNRIMAAIAQKILLVEATEKSGTIITARLAVEYNKDLLCIPGSIFSSRSEATNRLIREGATPILNSNHILEEFRINIEKLTEQKIENLSPDEKLILALLDSPKEKDHLVKESKLSVPDFLTALTMLEINNLIKINGTSISKK
jgi:DNA processing protein